MPIGRYSIRRLLLSGSLVLAIAIAIAIAAVAYVNAGREKSIVLTGIVTTDEIRVGSMLQGRVEALMVHPGDVAHKGELIARIAPQESEADVTYYRTTEQATAASVNESLAQLKFVERQTQESIRQAEATLEMYRAVVQQAEAALESAELNFNRQKALRSDELNSVQDFDQARVAYESAQAALESAQKQAAAAAAGLALVQANAEEVAARKASLEGMQRSFAAAGAQTEKAEVRLGYTEVRAPIDGIVDVRAALEGEVVDPGQTILTLIDPDDLWVRADVEESYIEEIRLGDKLDVRLPSGNTRSCEVFHRGVDADYATQRDVSRTKRDIKTFEIRLRCDNADRALAVGMTAYVTLPLMH